MQSFHPEHVNLKKTAFKNINMFKDTAKVDKKLIVSEAAIFILFVTLKSGSGEFKIYANIYFKCFKIYDVCLKH